MVPYRVGIRCHLGIILKLILRMSMNVYLFFCPRDLLNVRTWSLFDRGNRFYRCLVSHNFIISQWHAYSLFHLLALCIILYSTFFSSGELLCCILHVFISIKFLLLLEGKKSYSNVLGQ